VSALARILRHPAEAARTSIEGIDRRAMVGTSIASIAAGGAAFGAVVGSFRGAEQIAYAAIKVPLVLLTTLAIGVPAFYAIGVALDRRWSFRGVVALSVAAVARAALVLFALAPLLWMAIDGGLGYHAVALAATLVFAVGGAAGLGVLLRGIGNERGATVVATAIAATFLVIAAQTSWILRPYLVRPRTRDVPFLRAPEGGFADSLARSSRSAAGIYDSTLASDLESDGDAIERDAEQVR
jgi:hypothetical protein